MSSTTDKKSYGIDELSIGMSLTREVEVTDDTVRGFALVSGDHNPVHLDEEYASNTRFKKRIAHGMLGGSLFSTIFGTQLPGEGSIYVSQSLVFKRPIYIGDKIAATVTITRIDTEKRRVFFTTQCTVEGKVVIDGEAEIYIP